MLLIADAAPVSSRSTRLLASRSAASVELDSADQIGAPAASITVQSQDAGRACSWISWPR